MFRSALAAAWRHLVRSRGHAAIGVLGLAIGLAAFLLAALVVRDQRSRDHFIHGHERIYLLATAVTPPGRATIHLPNVNTFVGPWLKERSGIEAVTRLFLDNVRLQRGQVVADERIYWADANAFDLLPLPVLAGNLKPALQKPGAVVLPRSVARKYFGSDAPIGGTLQLEGGGVLTVAAVIEDLPSNGTHLQTGIFISTLTADSRLQQQDHIAGNVAGSPIGFGTNTYLRLASPAAAGQLRQELPALVEQLFSRPPPDWKMALRLPRMDELATDPALNPGVDGRLMMTLSVGLGILAIAVINFINLLSGRWSRRLPEAAMRRLAGASRGAVAAQLLGESLCYVTAAMLVAMALVELSVPHANAFLDAGIDFSYWRAPRLAVLLVAATLALGLLAGAWPAVVMSAFTPLQMLKGVALSHGAGLLRRGLVTLQFAILIGLVIAAGVVYLQRSFATRDAIRVDTGQMLVIRAPCTGFASALRGLPGVRGVACSDRSLLGGFSIMTMKSRDGVEQLVFLGQVSPEFFPLYGVKPVAGRLAGNPGGTYYVLNETAARRLGYGDSASAVGIGLPSTGRIDAQAPMRQVIGVVPDFSLTSVQNRIEALAYVVNGTDPGFDTVNVRLDGEKVEQTLLAMDALWRESGAREPMSRTFIQDHIQQLYAGMLRQARMFAGFALLAVLLAGIGLIGLAAATAERRRREIGIRKALGATNADVLRLLLWQFSKPVLWANCIAWPIAGWGMQRWLQGFAYRIELPVWLFPAAAFAALAIALLTVAMHSILVARSKPIAALRYE